MTTARTTQTIKRARLLASALLIAQGLLVAVPITALAQFAPIAGQSNSGSYANPANGYTTQRVPLIQGAPNTPANQQAQQGPPPPIGSGSTPQNQIQGDTGAPLPPGSDPADTTGGSLFQTGQGSDRTTVYIYSNDSANRGNRMVQTIRPSALTADQKSQIGSILGVNMDSGEAAVTANASPSQIAQIQSILFPYPGSQNTNGRTTITEDSPAPNNGINKPGEQSLYTYQGPLPTVRTFCRYLVILGVVAATIWMAMAAYSVVMGNQYGGARVISAASGLMMLLCAYTIWKIVQMNTFKDNSNTPAQNNSKAGGDTVSNAYLNPPNTPVTPTGQGRQTPQRSGVPLQPDGASINR